MWQLSSTRGTAEEEPPTNDEEVDLEDDIPLGQDDPEASGGRLGEPSRQRCISGHCCMRELEF